MRRAWPLLAGALWMLGSTAAQGANHVVVESQSVAPGATAVQIGVYLENDVPLNGLVLPLEFREITTTGAFPTNTITLTAANRLTTSLIGFVTSNQYANPDNANPGFCGGGGFATPSAVDFVSPDAFLYSAISVIDPCLPVGNDGAPPGGTPSLIFEFDVPVVDGLFVIDTTCITPANNILYVDCNTSSAVLPGFTRGEVIVGTPAFPPTVSDIPDQTIDEGQSFAAINLDDFVTDTDTPPEDIVWMATGQSALAVSISASRVATITTPNADWNGSETITFTATDPDAQFDSDAATFTVNPVNDPPVLAPIGPKVILAGKFLTFATSASDIDNAIIVMTAGGMPAGATYDGNNNGTGTFNWLTKCADEGTHNVTFIASDGALADTEVVTITVAPNPDTLTVNKDSLLFIYEAGGAPPAGQTVQIADPGCGELSWQAVSSETWLVLSADTGTTGSTIVLTVDTAGLAIGEYDALVTITEASPLKDGMVIQAEVAVHLSVVGELCICNCVGDPKCDGIPNVLDLVLAVNQIFHGWLIPGESTCWFFPLDANCDAVNDILDLVVMADHIFRDNQSPYCHPDGPCALPSPDNAQNGQPVTNSRTE